MCGRGQGCVCGGGGGVVGGAARMPACLPACHPLIPTPPTPAHTHAQIPTANDIPIDFRVSLLRNAPCSRTPMVHSSKAVGEPPLYLGGWLG